MAAVPPPVYVYSPEYVTLCDSLCKVPKRVSAAAGARGRGEHSGEARARKQPAPGTAVGKEEAGETPGERSVGLEREWFVCAFTSPLAPRAWTLKRQFPFPGGRARPCFCPGHRKALSHGMGTGRRRDSGRESRCWEESEPHLVCEFLGPWLLALCLLLSLSYSFL